MSWLPWFKQPYKPIKAKEPELRHWLIIRRQSGNYVMSIPADTAPALECFKDFIKWFHCRPQSETYRMKIRKGYYGLLRTDIIGYNLLTQRYAP